MKKNKNYILLFIIIFSHVFGFYFLSTSMVSNRSKSFSNSSEQSFDLLRFVKRRKEKDYITSTEKNELAEGEFTELNIEETQKSAKPFFRYIKFLHKLFTRKLKIAKHQLSSIPSKFLISPPAFNVAYHCFLI